MFTFSNKIMSNKWESNEEIQKFVEYLKIPSVHPDPDYLPCIEFLKKEASELELPVTIFQSPDDKATNKKLNILMEWTGLEPDLPKIILNSHMDVVPVYESEWIYPPFSGVIDEEGRIYARGSQDMKCLGMQYLAAIRSMKRDGVKLRRTVMVLFVPDEEICGPYGMEYFITTDEFKAMNIGFALDEGIATPDEVYPVFYGERCCWRE